LPQVFDAKQKYNIFKIGVSQMNFANGRENDDEFFQPTPLLQSPDLGMQQR
jgi:hypothetical protein